MIDINSFGIVGGDKRQIALAESIAADGYTVYAYGFDMSNPIKGVKMASLSDISLICDNIILPIPVTADGKNLNAPYCSKDTILDDHFDGLMKNKTVYGGMMGKLYQTSEVWDGIDTYDYFVREEFAIKNAVPTAEGAIEIAVREYPGALNGAKCLVVGYGRIGKVLSWMLRGIGADVTVSARKQSDLAWIQVFGYRSVHTDKICEEEKYDVIFNTVPAMVFTRKILSRLPANSLIIDLASSPGGVDCDAAEKLGITIVKALSLPGKVAPKEAGEIIKNTIYNMMEE